MYTREEFVVRFKGMETSWLTNRLARGISQDLLGFAKTNLLERRQLEIEQIAP